MTDQPYDPDRHDCQLVAAFEQRLGAERARDALLGAGLPGHSVQLIDNDAVEHKRGGEGSWQSLRGLFAPDDEARALGEALRSGHAMLVVHPQDPSERESALEILEACGPIDLEERDELGRPELNHASVSRADMVASAPPSNPAPASEPTFPANHSARDTSGTTYTHGVPANVAQAMTAEERILAQAPGVQSRVEIVEERLRVGWRDRSGRASRVRHYVVERDAPGSRVELREDEIGGATERPVS